MSNLCGLWLLALSLFVEVISYSIQFGIMHSLAVPVYEIEVYSSESHDYIDVKYKQKASLYFNINVIFVIDENEMEWKGQASILTGGIGYNFTTVRLTYVQPEVSKVTVLIYGLPR
ncbi:uncharacterized protein LOC108113211 [Drosophila eugracilis]|uniref:uncharacterized protein LOC108113211 n=1 Tax=Drosophila eugracilis TaxID=29029 RepID=UPI0007E79EC1|nr:uncharacterized protein LOC108113211 [Drosophila eugracilis]